MHPTRSSATIPYVMAAWTVIAVPLLIMFFALGMERVEARLRQVAVGENDVEEFLEQARPNEVRELVRHGIGRALELFRLRTRTRTPRPRASLPVARGARQGAGVRTMPAARHGKVAEGTLGSAAGGTVDGFVDDDVESVSEPQPRAS